MFDLDSVSLVGGGRVDADSRWAMPAHTHTSWEFIYFVRGSGRIDVPAQTLSPQAYHLVVYPPGLPHAIWQYDMRGRVPGIAGPVDLNRAAE